MTYPVSLEAYEQIRDGFYSSRLAEFYTSLSFRYEPSRDCLAVQVTNHSTLFATLGITNISVVASVGCVRPGAYMAVAFIVFNEEFKEMCRWN